MIPALEHAGRSAMGSGRVGGLAGTLMNTNHSSVSPPRAPMAFELSQEASTGFQFPIGMQHCSLLVVKQTERDFTGERRIYVALKISMLKWARAGNI